MPSPLRKMMKPSRARKAAIVGLEVFALAAALTYCYFC